MTRFRRLIALPLAAIIGWRSPCRCGRRAGAHARALRRRHVALVRRRWSTRRPACRPTTSPAACIRHAASAYTSPTNIGMYFWATLAARDLGFIGADEAVERISQTLTRRGHSNGTSRPASSGTGTRRRHGEKLTIWPEPPEPRSFPFASSVDNGWLASALLMVAERRSGAPRPGVGARREHELRLLLRPERQGADGGG